MDLQLKGKKVVVSPAASGLGAALYLAVLAEEAIPFGIDEVPFAGSELESMLKQQSWNSYWNLPTIHAAHYFQGNMTSPEDMAKVVDTIKKERHFRENPVYGLVSFAGFVQDYLGKEPLQMQTAAGLQMIKSELLTNLIAQDMDGPSGGSIVLLTTAPSAIPPLGEHAQRREQDFKQRLAMNCRTYAPAVRINVIETSYVATPSFEGTLERSDYHQQLVDQTPCKRIATSEEIVTEVLFALSPRSGYRTGSTLLIDGGLSSVPEEHRWGRFFDALGERGI
jgi:NAD(P)-dependent dehydrogenase (short-subunit alcohol dehydrogenase family)